MSVVLDVSRMAVDEHGVRDFVWPLAREEVLAMRDAMLAPLIAIARGSGDGEIISIGLGIIIGDAMTLYEAHAVHRRLLSSGIDLIPPSRSRVISAVAKGAAPMPSPVVDLMQAGLSRNESWARTAVAQMRYYARWNGLSPKMLRPLDLERDIVSVQRMGLIDRHARAIHRTVQYRPPGNWHHPLDSGWRRDVGALGISPATADAVLDAVRLGFAAGCEELPGYLDQFLRGWLSEYTAVIRRRLNILLENPGRLPKHLWTGTGGPWFNRILRHATRRSGGVVTGHDHGIGYGFLVQALPALIEFESCDVFIAYNKAQAEGLAKGLRAEWLILPKPPQIATLPSSNTVGAAAGNGKLTTRPLGIRRVMYASSFYQDERVRVEPNLPDVVAVDWEARLFGRLGEWGYETLHKPHPASVALPYPGFADSFNVKVFTDLFEEVMHEADALILTTPHTSILDPALKGDQPVVFIDFYLDEWVPEAYAMFARRCRIVKGWFDEENRPQVDWDDLRTAIEESRYLMDPSFYDHYIEIG